MMNASTWGGLLSYPVRVPPAGPLTLAGPDARRRLFFCLQNRTIEFPPRPRQFCFTPRPIASRPPWVGRRPVRTRESCPTSRRDATLRCDVKIHSSPLASAPLGLRGMAGGTREGFRADRLNAPTTSPESKGFIAHRAWPYRTHRGFKCFLVSSLHSIASSPQWLRSCADRTRRILF